MTMLDLPRLASPPAWQRDAACVEHLELDWFPERGVNNFTEVRAVCGGCLVRDECLDYALELGIKEGIWGGTTGRERRRMRADALGAERSIA